MEKTRIQLCVHDVLETVAKYFLLTMVLSFIGWVFEVIIIYLNAKRFYNSGFMTMPFCPIYGCSLMVAYFLLGTPNEGRGILKRVQNPILRYSAYLFFAFLIPTAAELIVGFFFDYFFDMWLWSYKGMPFNFRGYICIPVSIAWMLLIFLFMKFIFPRLKRAIFKIPKFVSMVLAMLLFIAVFADMAMAYAVI